MLSNTGIADPYICVRLQNVNPASIVGDNYQEIAQSFGVAMHKGFFCVARTRQIASFGSFMEILCVRHRGPRACKAMVMSSHTLETKLG